jgi:hypothetical protein
MASSVQVIKPGKYRNNVNPSTIVEAVTEAEMRMGEMRGRCLVYSRGKRFYVRSVGEFAEKFSPVEG